MLRTIIAFSRNERTLPNFVLARLQPKNIKIICEGCKLAAPLGFFRGFWPRFVSICYVILVVFCGIFRCLWRFGVFFELDFLTLVAFDQKGDAVLVQTGVRFLGRAKTNYIIVNLTWPKLGWLGHFLLAMFVMDYITQCNTNFGPGF